MNKSGTLASAQIDAAPNPDNKSLRDNLR